MGFARFQEVVLGVCLVDLWFLTGFARRIANMIGTLSRNVQTPAAGGLLLRQVQGLMVMARFWVPAGLRFCYTSHPRPPIQAG